MYLGRSEKSFRFSDGNRIQSTPTRFACNERIKSLNWLLLEPEDVLKLLQTLASCERSSCCPTLCSASSSAIEQNFRLRTDVIGVASGNRASKQKWAWHLLRHRWRIIVRSNNDERFRQKQDNRAANHKSSTTKNRLPIQRWVETEDMKSRDISDLDWNQTTKSTRKRESKETLTRFCRVQSFEMRE